MYELPQKLRKIPIARLEILRKLSLIHHMYAKYKLLKDEITNKQIEYMLANEGIISGDLEPNPEAYLREYHVIRQQSDVACGYLQENMSTLDQCLDLIEEILGNLDLEEDEKVYTVEDSSDWEEVSVSQSIEVSHKQRKSSQSETDQVNQQYQTVKLELSPHSNSNTKSQSHAKAKAKNTKTKTAKRTGSKQK